MNTVLLTDVDSEGDTLTVEREKAQRNAEYLAKLERSRCQIERGECVKMTFEEWEKRFCDGQY